MATDYYQMGMGLGGAYFDGKDIKRQRAYEDEKRGRERTQYDQAQDQYTRQRGMQTAEDAAVAEYTNQGNGVGPEQTSAIQGQYGMNPQQIAAQGGALQAKLQQYDVPDSYEVGTPAAAPGMQLRREQVSPRQSNATLGKIATARHDVKGMQDAQAQDKALHRDEIFNRAAAEYDTLSPEDNAKWAGGITNGYDGEIYVAGADKDGVLTVTLGSPDDRARKTISLNKAEARQMYTASRLMSEGFGDEAQKMLLAGGEKLRSIADEHNKFVVTNTKNENEARTNQTRARADQTRADADQTRAQAADRMSQFKAEREVPPELVDQMNRLSDAMMSEADPKKLDLMERQFNTLSARAATALGRVMPLPQRRGGAQEKPEMSFVDFVSTFGNQISSVSTASGSGKKKVSELTPTEAMREYRMAMGMPGAGEAPGIDVSGLERPKLPVRGGNAAPAVRNQPDEGRLPAGTGAVNGMMVNRYKD